MSLATTCRRGHRRFALPEEAHATVEFDHPYPGGHHCSMRMRDLSASGISFHLAHDLPGIEVGDGIDRVVLRIEGYEIRGDLLVMHLTPDATRGSVCGALFYPRGDRNLRALQALVVELEDVESFDDDGSEGFSLEGL
jgi:hypothetical protein